MMMTAAVLQEIGERYGLTPAVDDVQPAGDGERSRIDGGVIYLASDASEIEQLHVLTHALGPHSFSDARDQAIEEGICEILAHDAAQKKPLFSDDGDLEVPVAVPGPVARLAMCAVYLEDLGDDAAANDRHDAAVELASELKAMPADGRRRYLGDRLAARGAHDEADDVDAAGVLADYAAEYLSHPSLPADTRALAYAVAQAWGDAAEKPTATTRESLVSKELVLAQAQLLRPLPTEPIAAVLETITDINERAAAMRAIDGRTYLWAARQQTPKTTTMGGEFKESEHPRAADGKFGEGGGKGETDAGANEDDREEDESGIEEAYDIARVITKRGNPPPPSSPNAEHQREGAELVRSAIADLEQGDKWPALSNEWDNIKGFKHTPIEDVLNEDVWAEDATSADQILNRWAGARDAWQAAQKQWNNTYTTDGQTGGKEWAAALLRKAIKEDTLNDGILSLKDEDEAASLRPKVRLDQTKIQEKSLADELKTAAKAWDKVTDYLDYDGVSARIESLDIAKRWNGGTLAGKTVGELEQREAELEDRRSAAYRQATRPYVSEVYKEVAADLGPQLTRKFHDRVNAILEARIADNEEFAAIDDEWREAKREVEYLHAVEGALEREVDREVELAHEKFLQIASKYNTVVPAADFAAAAADLLRRDTLYRLGLPGDADENEPDPKGSR